MSRILLSDDDDEECDRTRLLLPVISRRNLSSSLAVAVSPNEFRLAVAGANDDEDEA